MTAVGPLPPVAPEVINILLLQRSQQVMDALSEHNIDIRLSART